MKTNQLRGRLTGWREWAGGSLRALAERVANFWRHPRTRQWTRWLIPVAMTVPLLLLLNPERVQRHEDRPPRGRAADTWLAADAPLEYAALEPAPGADLDFLPQGPDDASSADLASGPDAAALDLESAFDCVVEPSQVVEIGSIVTGVIKSIAVERSDVVEAGQVVVQLESGVETAGVALARARAENQAQIQAREASLDLGVRRKLRVNELFERQTLSLDLREQTETEEKIARLELVEAQEAQMLASLELKQAYEILKRRTIRSPLSGIVVERLMSPGEVVDEDRILTIAQLDPLRVEVILPSALFGTIETGMRAAVTPEFPGDEVHVASVTVVDRIIDAASGTFGVRLELANPEHTIPGGLHCQVRFFSAE